MAHWKDYEHLLRLAALFAGGVLVFLILQAVLVPSDFGETGHYRSSALAVNRDRPIVHAGETACLECHSDVQEVRDATPHKTVRCESCHGPQASHAAGGDPPARPDVTILCARCHARSASRPRAFPQVVVREHAGEETCTGCHTPHAPGLSEVPQ
jgi:hypothetical protein